MNHEEFGKYLSEQRELRGLSRDDISRVTKIPPALVEALEEGEVRRLPGRVFVMRYVRAYAETIGLEPNETTLRYEEVDPAPEGQALDAELKPPPAPVPGMALKPAPGTPAASAERTQRRGLWLVVGIFAGIAWVAWWVLSH